eukprot:SAG31_NODE_2355_length_5879_cov_6.732526_2_plen_232_part_00
MRARLERKLKQRQQAKKSALEPEPEQLIVSPSLEALAEEYGTFKLKKDVDAACREAAEERAKVTPSLVQTAWSTCLCTRTSPLAMLAYRWHKCVRGAARKEGGSQARKEEATEAAQTGGVSSGGPSSSSSAAAAAARPGARNRRSARADVRLPDPAVQSRRRGAPGRRVLVKPSSRYTYLAVVWKKQQSATDRRVIVKQYPPCTRDADVETVGPPMPNKEKKARVKTGTAR